MPWKSKLTEQFAKSQICRFDGQAIFQYDARMERLVIMEDVLRLVPFSRQYLYVLMDRGEFPRPLKIGVRRIAWRESDIESWISKKTTS